MAKKKLTKAQIKKTYKAIHTNLAKLLMDKTFQADSMVPQSRMVIDKMLSGISNATNRIK